MSAIKALLSNRLKNWRKISIFPVLALLFIFIVINGVISPSFFKLSYLKSFFSSNVPLMLLAIGVAMVIIGDGIDISLGSLATVVNSLCIILTVDWKVNMWVTMLFVLVAATFCGFLNGCVISIIKVPPLLATFAMTSIYDGIALWIMPKPRAGIPGEFVKWYNGATGVVPNSVWILLGVVLIWLLITRMPFKIKLYSMGQNRLNSFASGVPVVRTQIFTYGFAAFMAGLAGILAPLFKPLGLGDWRICTSLISGVMAKESVVSVLEVLFAAEGGVAAVLSPVAAGSLLIFSLLYCPCVAAIASVKRELGVKWAIGVAVWQCVLAWIAAFLFYTVACLFV